MHPGFKKESWEQVKEYFTFFKPIGTIITRKKYLKDNDNLSQIVLDNYRYYLSKIDIIETDGKGNYKKIKEIPENFTLYHLKNEYYKRKYEREEQMGSCSKILQLKRDWS